MLPAQYILSITTQCRYRSQEVSIEVSVTNAYPTNMPGISTQEGAKKEKKGTYKTQNTRKTNAYITRNCIVVLSVAVFCGPWQERHPQTHFYSQAQVLALALPWR